jgi:hypothetical protein
MTYREGWMMLLNCVYKLSVSSNKYPLPITSFHTWNKHDNCGRMSHHHCLLSPRQGHVQQSALNRYWYVLSFVPWDSVHFLSVRRLSNCNILHHSTNMQQNCLIYNLQYCGILQVTCCSFSLNPPLLLYDLLHTSTYMCICVFRWLWTW